MSSVNSEIAEVVAEYKGAGEPLVGIDPEDTTDVKISGGTFTIGVIPSGIWDRLYFGVQTALQEANRKAIREMADRGEDPDEVIYEEAEIRLTKAQMTASLDPTYRASLLKIQLEAVRYGVRAHAGFKNRRNKDFPCVLEMTSYEGDSVPALDTGTMRIYKANRDLVTKLWPHIRALHEIGAPEKKD